MKKDTLHKYVDLYTDYKSDFWDVLATISLTVWGVLQIDNCCFKWISFVVIIVVIFFSKREQLKKQTTISKLEKDISDKGAKIQKYENTIETFGKDNTALFNAFLHLFSKSINIANNDRITVYKVSGNKFITIGRYSPNPSYNDFRRLEIPKNEGFIAKALSEGEILIKDLPDPKKRNGQQYKKEITNKCDISHNTLDGLRMKSRFYYCKAVADYSDRNRKAVIVFESTKENRFATKEEISSLIEKEEKRIQTFVENCRFIPESNIEEAIKKGF